MKRRKSFSLAATVSLCALGFVSMMGAGCSDGTSASDLLGAESATASGAAGTDGAASDGLEMGPEGPRGPRIDIQEELGLTDEQAEAMKTARESFREEMKTVREALRAEEMTLDEAVSQVTELAESHDATIQTILSADQWSQWETLHAERVAERIDRINEYAAEMVERQLERLTETLGLSADQVTAIETILEAGVASQLATLEEVQSGDLHPAAARLLSGADRAESREEIAALLTDEQVETFEELADRRRGGPGRGGPGDGGPGRGGHHGGGRGPA